MIVSHSPYRSEYEIRICVQTIPLQYLERASMLISIVRSSNLTPSQIGTKSRVSKDLGISWSLHLWTIGATCSLTLTQSSVFIPRTCFFLTRWIHTIMAAEAKAQTELKDFGSLFSLEGKVVVVTGGSRGLGLHAASGYVLSRRL